MLKPKLRMRANTPGLVRMRERFFGEGDISGVVGRGLDPPMGADGVRGAGSVERGVGDMECGLAGVTQQTGLAVAPVLLLRVNTSRSTRMMAAT